MKKKLILIISTVFLFSYVFANWSSSQVEKSALRSSQFDSFNEVWRQLSFNPWTPFDQWNRPNELPHYPGVSPEELVELMSKKFNSLFNGNADMSEWSHEGQIDFGERTRELFTNSANFKKPGVKWLHPRGVCAKGRWIIREDSPATGLFKKGTNVSTIIRVSSGTAESERYDDEGELQQRIFGLAIKLFHQTDDGKEAITSNIVTLDHRGFSRSDRPFVVFPRQDEELFFTNVAPVERILGSGTPIMTGAGKALSWALDMFDNPNFARPVYVTASYDDKSQPVVNSVTPFKIKLVPRFEMPSREFADFRLELLEYNQGTFDILISELDEGEDYGDKKIGEIQLDFPMILTHNCDQRLAFHHSPVQWKEKYEDPNLVRDRLEK